MPIFSTQPSLDMLPISSMGLAKEKPPFSNFSMITRFHVFLLCHPQLLTAHKFAELNSPTNKDIETM